MRTVLIAVVQLVCAGALWWLSRDAGPAAPVTSGDVRESDEDPAGTRVDAASLLDAGTIDMSDAKRSERAQVSPPATDVTLIRGRCVDAAGRPIVNVRTTLSGNVNKSHELARYLCDHPPLAWRDPAPVTTGTDGTFKIRVTPPPPYEFRLHLWANDPVPTSSPASTSSITPVTTAPA